MFPEDVRLFPLESISPTDVIANDERCSRYYLSTRDRESKRMDYCACALHSTIDLSLSSKLCYAIDTTFLFLLYTGIFLMFLRKGYFRLDNISFLI